MTAGLAVLVYGIVSTDVHPWGSPQTIVTLAIGLALLAVFFVTEARFAKDPLIPLSIFKRRSLSVANGIAVTIGAGHLRYLLLPVPVPSERRRLQRAPCRPGLPAGGPAHVGRSADRLSHRAVSSEPAIS